MPKSEEKFIIINKNHLKSVPPDILARFMTVLSEMERFLPKNKYFVCNQDTPETSNHLRCLKVSENAILPTRQTPGSAGYDLHALFGGQILPGEMAVIRTGIAIEIPENHVGMVLPRSGLSTLGIVAIPSVIDSDYRGEIRLILHNINQGLPGMDNNVFAWKAKDRLGQLLILPCLMSSVKEVSTLTPTERGANGFGHTGINHKEVNERK